MATNVDLPWEHTGLCETDGAGARIRSLRGQRRDVLRKYAPLTRGCQDALGGPDQGPRVLHLL